MDHVVVLLEQPAGGNAREAASAEAATAAEVASGTGANATVRPGGRVFGRLLQRPQMVVHVFADHVPVCGVHVLVERFVFREFCLKDLRRFEQRPPRS